MKDDKQEKAKRAKWEQPEIDDFQENDSQQGELPEDERAVISSYYQKGCYPMPYGMGLCQPRKGTCYPNLYGGYPSHMHCAPRQGCYPFHMHCAPRHGCNPYFYYGGNGTYCRPYGFNYGYGCYPRR